MVDRPPKLELISASGGGGPAHLSALAIQLDSRYIFAKGMVDSLSQNVALASNGELVKQEEAVNKIAWFGGLAVTAVTLACLLTLVVASDGAWWQYVLYVAIAGVPLGYVIFSQLVMRRMDLAIFSRYRDDLVDQLTDLQGWSSVMNSPASSTGVTFTR
jgi:hypothetical protein